MFTSYSGGILEIDDISVACTQVVESVRNVSSALGEEDQCRGSMGETSVCSNGGDRYMSFNNWHNSQWWQYITDLLETGHTVSHFSSSQIFISCTVHTLWNNFWLRNPRTVITVVIICSTIWGSLFLEILVSQK